MKKAPLPSMQDDGGLPALPEPAIAEIGAVPYGVLIAGLGGTGVVTVSAILGMAAHLEGKGVGVIDMAGLAQKGGAVYCHVKIGRTPADVHAIRIAAGEADLLLGCDPSSPARSRCSPPSSRARRRCSSTAPRCSRRYRAQSDFVPFRRDQAGDPPGRRAGVDLHRHLGARAGAARRLDRRQYFHPRLCLAEGLTAVRVDRAPSN
jgi:hypothetical protein